MGAVVAFTVMAFGATNAEAGFAGPADVGGGLEALFGAENQVSASEMDDMRGGFTTSSGILINFGFDISTFINGERVSQTAMQPVTVNGNGNIVSNGTPSIEVLQQVVNGPVTTTITDSGIINTIQNNLNNQTIQTIQTFHIDVFGLSNVVKSAATSSYLLHAVQGFK